MTFSPPECWIKYESELLRKSCNYYLQPLETSRVKCFLSQNKTLSKIDIYGLSNTKYRLDEMWRGKWCKISSIFLWAYLSLLESYLWTARWLFSTCDCSIVSLMVAIFLLHLHIFGYFVCIYRISWSSHRTNCSNAHWIAQIVSYEWVAAL